MVRFLLMRYFKPSALLNVREYWHEFSSTQRLTIGWIGLTLLVSVVFWLSVKIIPENPTVFRYFVSLYAINSLMFFVVLRDNLLLSRTFLAFLLILQLLAGAYYGFNYLSLGV